MFYLKQRARERAAALYALVRPEVSIGAELGSHSVRVCSSSRLALPPPSISNSDHFPVAETFTSHASNSPCAP